MSETKLVRCPICQKLKRAAANCLTCAVTAISAADPHAHTHQEKFILKPTKAVLTVQSSASDTGHLGTISFKVMEPPESS
jgi:hypothetical protein